jgi:NAD+ synthase
MTFEGDEAAISNREREVLAIYRKLNLANQHKMLPIPVCKIPESLK